MLRGLDTLLQLLVVSCLLSFSIHRPWKQSGWTLFAVLSSFGFEQCELLIISLSPCPLSKHTLAGKLSSNPLPRPRLQLCPLLQSLIARLDQALKDMAEQQRRFAQTKRTLLAEKTMEVPHLDAPLAHVTMAIPVCKKITDTCAKGPAIQVYATTNARWCPETPSALNLRWRNLTSTGRHINAASCHHSAITHVNSLLDTSLTDQNTYFYTVSFR